MLVAAGLGSLIGAERERLVWAAGLRTHMLVSVGACLFMIVSAFGFRNLVNYEAGLREFSSETFPRSASLLQVCMGILCKSGLLSGPLQKYSCHVTEHLAQLFPEVRALSPIFEYSQG